MREHVIRAGRVVGGGFLLVLGVVGLFLPILQGWLFIILGLTLLSSESEVARRILHRLRSSRWVPQRWRLKDDHDGQRGA